MNFLNAIANKKTREKKKLCVFADAWSTRMFVANVLCKRNYLVPLKWIHVLGWTFVSGLLGCVCLVFVLMTCAIVLWRKLFLFALLRGAASGSN